MFIPSVVAVDPAVFLLSVGCFPPPDLPIPVREDAIIAGVTIINPSKIRLADHSIVVRDGLIHEVRPRLASDPKPICADCYAVPGLIDVHVHTPPRIALGNQQLFALLYLAHGVTTVRDAGDLDGTAYSAATSDWIDGGHVGPRLLRSGPFIVGGDGAWANSIRVDSIEDVHAAVAPLKAAGY